MRIVRFFLPILFLLAPSITNAQSLLYCYKGDDYLPVANVIAGVPMCFTGDSLLKGKRADLILYPSTDFGEGFIDIEVVEHSREGVVNQKGVLYFVSTRGWYLLHCKITADRDMQDCYGALRFDEYGRCSFYMKSLGDLKVGETKTFRVYMKLGYEMPERLHLFSGMNEIRTSLIPRRYEYDANLIDYASN